MNILGLSITRSGPVEASKAADLVTHIPAASQSAGWFSWWPSVTESFAGAWQRNVTLSVDTVLAHSTAWACVTLIASDIAKLRLKLVEEGDDDICTEVENPAYTPVLRKPNHYQNRIQFLKYWLISKLTRGNTYALKERDRRGVVTALYILDPARVTPLVALNGEVFYQLGGDDLSGIGNGGVTVPAREIIHDIYVAPYHPLCGVSPLFACAGAAAQGLKIVNNTSKLFQNGSQPGGVLTAPGSIGQETAKRIQEHWDTNFTGEANIGRVAVLGDGLKFEPMSMTAVDAQLIDQLKWGDEKICSAYHVPPYMVGVGPAPTYNNIEALNQQYYAQCLQILIEELELCLDEGLTIEAPLEVECDLDALLRMDSATKMKTATDGVRGGIYTPNEGRAMFNKKPLTGGDTVYLQDQDHSLEWLSRRDEMTLVAAPEPVPAAAADMPPPEPSATEKAIDFATALRAGMRVRVKECHVAA